MEARNVSSTENETSPKNIDSTEVCATATERMTEDEASHLNAISAPLASDDRNSSDADASSVNVLLQASPGKDDITEARMNSDEESNPQMNDADATDDIEVDSTLNRTGKLEKLVQQLNAEISVLRQEHKTAFDKMYKLSRIARQSNDPNARRSATMATVEHKSVRLRLRAKEELLLKAHDKLDGSKKQVGLTSTYIEGDTRSFAALGKCIASNLPGEIISASGERRNDIAHVRTEFYKMVASLTHYFLFW